MNSSDIEVPFIPDFVSQNFDSLLTTESTIVFRRVTYTCMLFGLICCCIFQVSICNLFC